MITITELFHQILLNEAKEKAVKAKVETTGHMTHVGDWSMYGDPTHGLRHMEAMKDWFEGKETPGHTVSIKADGGVSVIVGRKENGQHFISYKSGKKLFHSPEEIDAAGVPWAETGKHILSKVQQMNIKPGTAFQGDVMWANRNELEDGHARPNTIRYKTTHHPLSIAVHGQYAITDNGDLIRTSNTPDISQLKHHEVHIPNLQLKAGSIRLTRARQSAVKQSLKSAREALTPEVQNYAKTISQDKDIHKFLQEYMNEIVATTGNRSIESLRKYLHEPLSDKITSSAYKNKATQRKMKEPKRNALVEKIEKHIEEHAPHVEGLLSHMQHLTDAKHHMLDQIKESQGLHDLIPGHGHEHEGVVSAIDGYLAKLTREGEHGFSSQNRERGVERGFFNPQPVQEEMTVGGAGVGMAGLGTDLTQDDIAIYPKSAKKYKRRTKRLSPTIGRLMKNLNIGQNDEPT